MVPTRVRIFASHPIAWAEYRRLLCTTQGCLVVEDEGAFDVGVFDGEHPSLDAVLALAVLRTPLMRPLLVTARCDEAACLGWLMRGVWGIVSYDRYAGELGRALESLAGGQLWVPASVVLQYVRLEKAQCLPPSANTLTEREQEILGLLLRRLSNKEIGTILHITLRTVKFHVGNILHKLQATSRKDLAAYPSNHFSTGLPDLPVPQAVPRSS